VQAMAMAGRQTSQSTTSALLEYMHPNLQAATGVQHTRHYCCYKRRTKLPSMHPQLRYSAHTYTFAAVVVSAPAEVQTQLKPEPKCSPFESNTRSGLEYCSLLSAMRNGHARGVVAVARGRCMDRDFRTASTLLSSPLRRQQLS